MATTAFILNEIDILYRPVRELEKRPSIQSSYEAYKLFRDNWDDMKICLQEQFKVMLLNRSSRVLGIANISTGGISSTIADPKLIMAVALKAAATGLILAHNHPSGNTRPSETDLKLTHKLVQGANFLDMSVLDHLIITDQDYLSMADEGLLPSAPSTPKRQVSDARRSFSPFRLD